MNAIGEDMILELPSKSKIKSKAIEPLISTALLLALGFLSRSTALLFGMGVLSSFECITAWPFG